MFIVRGTDREGGGIRRRWTVGGLLGRFELWKSEDSKLVRIIWWCGIR